MFHFVHACRRSSCACAVPADTAHLILQHADAVPQAVLQWTLVVPICQTGGRVRLLRSMLYVLKSCSCCKVEQLRCRLCDGDSDVSSVK